MELVYQKTNEKLLNISEENSINNNTLKLQELSRMKVFNNLLTYYLKQIMNEFIEKQKEINLIRVVECEFDYVEKQKSKIYKF